MTRGLAPKESVIETLCGWPDGLADGGFRVSASIPMVRLPSWETSGSRVATPPGVFARHPFRIGLLSLRIPRAAGFGAPTARAAFENVSVMQQAIQHGGDSGAVAEQFSPVVYGAVGGQQCARTFVAAHDDLQQFLGGGKRQLAHSQIIDSRCRHSFPMPYNFRAGVRRTIRAEHVRAEHSHLR